MSDPFCSADCHKRFCRATFHDAIYLIERQVAQVALENQRALAVIVFLRQKVGSELGAASEGDPTGPTVPVSGRGDRVEVTASAWVVFLDVPIANHELDGHRGPVQEL